MHGGVPPASLTRTEEEGGFLSPFGSLTLPPELFHSSKSKCIVALHESESVCVTKTVATHAL